MCIENQQVVTFAALLNTSCPPSPLPSRRASGALGALQGREGNGPPAPGTPGPQGWGPGGALGPAGPGHGSPFGPSVDTKQNSPEPQAPGDLPGPSGGPGSFSLTPPPRGLWGTPGDSGEPLQGFRENLKLRASGGPPSTCCPVHPPVPVNPPGGLRGRGGGQDPPVGFCSMATPLNIRFMLPRTRPADWTPSPILVPVTPPVPPLPLSPSRPRRGPEPRGGGGGGLDPHGGVLILLSPVQSN